MVKPIPAIFGFGFCLLLLIGCIRPNQQNPVLVLNLMGMKPEMPVTWTQESERNACILTAQNVNPRLSYCFNVSPANCNLDFFINFTSQAKIQNRKDDLTFISINYANCNAATTNLFPTYNALKPPASMIFKLLSDSNGSFQKTDFSIVHNKSCEALKFSSINPSVFTRILREEEILSLNNLQSEIGMVTASNNACLVDLSVPQTTINFLGSIRNQVFQIGYVCQNSSTANQSCPWSHSE